MINGGIGGQARSGLLHGDVNTLMAGSSWGCFDNHPTSSIIDAKVEEGGSRTSTSRCASDKLMAVAENGGTFDLLSRKDGAVRP